MTRRKFIQKLINAGSTVIVGVWWLAKKAVPRKFVRAKTGRFPGSLKPLADISKQGRWSG